MTNFATLTNTIQGMYEGKQDYIDSLNRYSLLIIDDLGAERRSEYMQEMVFNIIDSRYRSGLPMIVTTNLINGKRMKIVLDKDPGYFYDGRCSVNEYASDRNLHQITVSVTCSPYKLKTTITSKSVTASSTEKTVTLACGRRPVVPEITCTAAVTITQGSVSANLSAGTHKPFGIRLVEGSNSLKVKGSGTVTIKYQEGDL